MKLSKQKPPIYEKCRQKFGVDWDKGIIITYGDTVYCKYDLPPDLIAHEAIHVKQQKYIGKDKWWEQYFSSPEFRLLQEVEAYTAQLKWAKQNYSRQARRALFRKCVHDMATLYGNMCTKEEAEKLLSIST